MLTNNFRNLFKFTWPATYSYKDDIAAEYRYSPGLSSDFFNYFSDFVDVKGRHLGRIYSRSDANCSVAGETAYNDGINGYNQHPQGGHNRSYNYNPTISCANNIDELADNSWYDLVSNPGSTNRRAGNCAFVAFVGSGTTAPTVDDYRLESRLVLTAPLMACYHDADNKTRVIRVFTNQTGASVTVSEMGIYLVSSYINNKFLLGRNIFDTPIVLADGATQAFTYIIDMSNLTFQDADEVQVAAA